MYLISLSFGLLSCSQVNVDSREQFFQNQTLRHGIIPTSNKTLTRPIPIDEKAVMRGEEVYAAKCIACHGDRGRGDGEYAKVHGMKPKDLMEVIRSVPNFQFFISVSEKVGSMPGWNSYLSEENLRDLSHYLRSLAK